MTVFEQLEMQQNRLSALEKLNQFPQIHSMNFNDEQIEELLLGLEHGINITWYLDENFNSKQMMYIRLGLEENLDVSIYAKHHYGEDNMRYIYLALSCRGNVTYYLDPNLNVRQLFQIWHGIKQGVDVSGYADSSIPFEIMNQKRIELLKEKRGE